MDLNFRLTAVNAFAGVIRRAGNMKRRSKLLKLKPLGAWRRASRRRFRTKLVHSKGAVLETPTGEVVPLCSENCLGAMLAT